MCRLRRRWRPCHAVVQAGKVRYIGASSMFAWQFSQSLYTADLRGWTRFISMQNHYNVIYREEEREMNPLCEITGDWSYPVESAGAWRGDRVTWA